MPFWPARAFRWPDPDTVGSQLQITGLYAKATNLPIVDEVQHLVAAAIGPNSIQNDLFQLKLRRAGAAAAIGIAAPAVPGGLPFAAAGAGGRHRPQEEGQATGRGWRRYQWQ